METLLKINILLLLFYGFYILILEKYKLLLYNRIYLIFGIITSIGLPFFNYTKNVTIKIPETNDKLYNTKINDLTSNSFVESTTTNFTIDYLSIFYWISVIIIGIFLIKMFFAMFQLFLLYKNGTKINILNTDVIQHEKVTNPFSFVKIFLPIKKLNNLDLIILHERAHCVQKHYLDNIIAHVLRAFFWYNPIVWLYKNAIIQNLEFLADEAVIQENINKKQYQLSLIEILKQNNFPNYSLTNAYSESLTLKRIKMMNQKINPKGNWKFLVILPLLSIFFMFFQQKTVTNIVITNKENTNNKLYLIQNNFTENEIENKFKEFNTQYDLNLDLKEIEYNEDNKIKHIKIGYLKENFSLTKKDGISGIDMRFSKDNFYISPIKYKNNDPRELAIINQCRLLKDLT